MSKEKLEFKKLYKISHKKDFVYCYICNKKITNPNELTVDHEPPKSRQKELGDSKLYPCCRRCNNRKGALTLEEYKKWLLLEAKRNGHIK